MHDLFSNASWCEYADARRRKLLFRAWRRGTQEADLILGSFADESLGGLSGAQLSLFEALLDCADADLFDWIFDTNAPPPAHDHEVMRQLRGFCAMRHPRLTANRPAQI
jgi:antitoxin CptB